jgi:hypothetical protein
VHAAMGSSQGLGVRENLQRSGTNLTFDSQ